MYETHSLYPALITIHAVQERDLAGEKASLERIEMLQRIGRLEHDLSETQQKLKAANRTIRKADPTAAIEYQSDDSDSNDPEGATGGEGEGT